VSKCANADWARKTVARYRDLDRVRAEVEEKLNIGEKERMRPSCTRALWTELRECLRAKVSAFNTEWGEDYVKCQDSPNGFSIALPPYDEQTESARASLRYSRRRSVFFLTHGDEPIRGGPQSALFVLRSSQGNRYGDVEVCIFCGNNRLMPYVSMTPEQAAEWIVESLLGL